MAAIHRDAMRLGAKLLVDAGKACALFHDQCVRGVKARRIQVDEIWSFTYAKQRNVAKAKAAIVKSARDNAPRRLENSTTT